MSTVTFLLIIVVLMVLLGPIMVTLIIQQRQDIKLMKRQISTYLNQCELNNRLSQYKSDSGEFIVEEKRNDMVI